MDWIRLAPMTSHVSDRVGYLALYPKGRLQKAAKNVVMAMVAALLNNPISFRIIKRKNARKFVPLMIRQARIERL